MPAHSDSEEDGGVKSAEEAMAAHILPGPQNPLCKKCGLYKACKSPFQGVVWQDERGDLHDGYPPDDARPDDGWVVVLNDAPDTRADEMGSFGESESVQFLKKFFESSSSAPLRGRAVFIPTMRCAPQVYNKEGDVVEYRPKKPDIARCFNHFVNPWITQLRPRAVVASGYLASNRVIGRMDFQNLVGRTYSFNGAVTRAVWPVDFLLRDVRGQQQEYVKIWREALDRIDNKDLENVWDDTISYDLITTPEALKSWLKPILSHIRERVVAGERPIPLAWDTETSSLEIWMKGFYVGLLSFDHPAQANPCVIPLLYPGADKIFRRENPGDTRSWDTIRADMEDIIKKVLTSPAIPLAGHNLVYDENAMHKQYGYECEGFYADTMLLNFLLHPEEKGLNSLDDLCRKFLPNIPHYWDRLYAYREEHGIDNYMDIPEKMLFPYAAYDTRVTSLILAEMEKLLDITGYGGWFIRAGVDEPKTPTYSMREYAIYGRSVHHRMCGHLQRYGQHFDKDLVELIHSHYSAERKVRAAALEEDENLVRFEREVLGPKSGPSTDAHKLWRKWREGGMVSDMETALQQAKAGLRQKMEEYKASMAGWRKRRKEWVKATANSLVESATTKLEGDALANRLKKIKSAEYKNILMGVFSQQVESPPEKPDPIRISEFKKAFKKSYRLPSGPIPEHLRPRISWGSGPQQKLFFIDYLNLPIIKVTATGGPCLDADVLQSYSKHPYNNQTAQRLLAWREIDKFLVSFIEPIVYADEMPPNKRIVHDDGLIHAAFGAGDTTTGRLACKRPNLQATPRDGLVKKIYGSRHGKDGWIFTRDYSGLEVRVLALTARDASLIHTFRTGGDPHFDITQKHFFGDLADAKNKSQRAICKRSLFGNIYGQGDQGLLDILTADGVLHPSTGKPITLEECKEFNQMLYDAFPGVRQWVENAHQQGIDYHWTASGFGFVRPLASLKSYRSMKRKQAAMTWDERKSSRRLRLLEMDIQKDLRRSQNMPIQSCASDITLFAAYWINESFKREGLGTRVFNIVHDDIWSDIPCDDEVSTVARIYKDTMDHVPEWIGELLPGYDASWMDIPIIGEAEIGVNPKDALGVVEEPTKHDASKQLLLTVPADSAADYTVSSIDEEKGTAIIPFIGNEAAIKETLRLKRMVF